MLIGPCNNYVIEYIRTNNSKVESLQTVRVLGTYN